MTTKKQKITKQEFVANLSATTSVTAIVVSAAGEVVRASEEVKETKLGEISKDALYLGRGMTGKTHIFQVQ